MADLTSDQRAELADAIARHREALAVLADVEWRVGHTLGATVYAVTGQGAYKQDAWIGDMHTPELAKRVVADHNRNLDQGATAAAIADHVTWFADRRLELRIAPAGLHGLDIMLADDEGNHIGDVIGNPGQGLPELLAAARTVAETERYAP